MTPTSSFDYLWFVVRIDKFHRCLAYAIGSEVNGAPNPTKREYYMFLSHSFGTQKNVYSTLHDRNHTLLHLNPSSPSRAYGEHVEEELIIKYIEILFPQETEVS
ncbi:MAG: hypothetical protein ABIH34_00370 [Nanoarchaeota archaeon]